MRVECAEVGLVVTFEIKVEKDITCRNLKFNMLSIVNQILRAKKVSFEYVENDIKLSKATYIKETIPVRESRSSSVERKLIPKKLYVLSDYSKIEENFNYIQRFIICTIAKNISEKENPALQRRLTINTNTSNIVTNIFDTVKESTPCRDIKIETYKFSKTLEDDIMNKNSSGPYVSKCCKCTLI